MIMEIRAEGFNFYLVHTPVHVYGSLTSVGRKNAKTLLIQNCFIITHLIHEQKRHPVSHTHTTTNVR